MKMIRSLPVVQHSPSFTPPFSNEADASSESKPLEFEGFDVRENRLDHVHFRTCQFHVAVALLPAAATCVGGQRNVGLKSPGFRRRARLGRTAIQQHFRVFTHPKSERAPEIHISEAPQTARKPRSPKVPDTGKACLRKTHAIDPGAHAVSRRLLENTLRDELWLRGLRISR